MRYVVFEIFYKGTKIRTVTDFDYIEELKTVDLKNEANKYIDEIHEKLGFDLRKVASDDYLHYCCFVEVIYDVKAKTYFEKATLECSGREG